MKQTIPFDFQEIYNSLVEIMYKKGYDAPYEGSNLAQLLTIISYATSMLNANTAININEMLLTLAQKHKNIIQDAKVLGYEPTQARSYIYQLELKFKDHKIYNFKPEKTFFTSNGKFYYYLDKDFELDLTDKSIDLENFTHFINVKEGTLISKENDKTLLKFVTKDQFFTIPYENIEDDGIFVTVTPPSNKTFKQKPEIFKKSNILLLDNNDTLQNSFIRIQDIETKTPTIYFQYAGAGKPLRQGSEVDIRLLITSGPQGFCNETWDSLDENIEINSFALLQPGTDIESLESIRLNAPLLNNTASRLVVANDYEAICRKHGAVKLAKVFGGEDEYPEKLGNIYFSLTPESQIRNIVDLDDYKLNFQAQDIRDYEKTKNIKNLNNNLFLLEDQLFKNFAKKLDTSSLNYYEPGVIDLVRNYNLPSLEYNIRNPVYILIDISVDIVKYGLTDIKTQVREKIKNLISQYILKLENFETEYFESNLINIIDDNLTSTSGLELDTSFNIILSPRNIYHETINSVYFAGASEDPYLANPSFEGLKETFIKFYLDTPYEKLYKNKYLILENLPKFGESSLGKLEIDTSTYKKDEKVYDFSKECITFLLKLDGKIVGTYKIINKRETYIEVKFYVSGDGYAPKMFIKDKCIEFDKVDSSKFNNIQTIKLIYPSNNFKTTRNTIFKLNKIMFKEIVKELKN